MKSNIHRKITKQVRKDCMNPRWWKVQKYINRKKFRLLSRRELSHSDASDQQEVL